MAIRLVIIDDHPVIRSGLRGMLVGHTEFECIGEAEDGEGGLKLVQAVQPDVVLLDLRLPDIDGLDMIQHIHAIDASIRILIVTSYSHIYDIKAAMQLGAKGYVLKDIPRAELYSAIHRVAKGQVAYSHSTMEHLINLVDDDSSVLSIRERHVLELVAQGITNKAIATELSIGEATVKSHLSTIYRKLNVVDRASAVAVALKRRLIDI